jgi:hypothetical protein
MRHICGAKRSASRYYLAASGLVLADRSKPCFCKNGSALAEQPATGLKVSANAKGPNKDDADAAAARDIVVIGYAQSLKASASAKKNATNFSDSIFAEDIGKFPDLNLTDRCSGCPACRSIVTLRARGPTSTCAA